MSDKLVVEVNGQVAVAYARKPIPGRQRKYIDALEEDMSEGISLFGEFHESPSAEQRTHYVIGELLHALALGDDHLVALLCAYLDKLTPNLMQINVTDQPDTYDVTLDYQP